MAHLRLINTIKAVCTNDNFMGESVICTSIKNEGDQQLCNLLFHSASGNKGCDKWWIYLAACPRPSM